MSIEKDIEIRRTTINDIEEQSLPLKGWGQSYVQIEGGLFDSLIDTIEFACNTTWIRKTTNRALRKSFAIPTNKIGFAFILEGSDPVRFEGISLEPGDAFFIPGGDQLDLVCCGRFEVFVLCGAPQAILGHSCSQDESEIFRKSVVKGRSSLRLIRIAEDILFNAVSINNMVTAHEINDRITAFCRSLIPNSAPLSVSRPRALEIVDAACRLMLGMITDPEDAVPIMAVASNLGVSLRTLEYSFHHHLGISPTRFKTLIRLHAARRDLRLACNKIDVTQVAMKWGFWHLGRFSSTYEAIFGELPSITLKACMQR